MKNTEVKDKGQLKIIEVKGKVEMKIIEMIDKWMNVKMIRIEEVIDMQLTNPIEIKQTTSSNTEVSDKDNDISTESKESRECRVK